MVHICGLETRISKSNRGAITHPFSANMAPKDRTHKDLGKKNIIIKYACNPKLLLEISQEEEEDLWFFSLWLLLLSQSAASWGIVGSLITNYF